MTKHVFTWLLISGIMLCAPVFAGDLDTIIKQCDDCHGDNGVSQWSDMPTIAGIDAFTHSYALSDYAADARPCPPSTFRQGDTTRAEMTMCDVAKELSDASIEAVAEHFAALPFVAAKQPFDAALAAQGKVIHERDCARCHSNGGSDPEDEAGILAGQWMCYLEAAFADYSSGAREQSDKMKVKMDALSADDTKALLHYYASQQ